ncbi:hypothetical protein G7054_g13628 [Neopestalotiopsis clavispora]|nr:hypothetical protein G7054_g13628 [Neopestalotiopsis clavispora]
MGSHVPGASVQQSSEYGDSAAIPTGTSPQIPLSTEVHNHGLAKSDFGTKTQSEDSEATEPSGVCSITGQEHLSLQQFGIQKCPKCLIDLLDDGASQNSHPQLPLQDQDADISSQISQILSDVKEVKSMTHDMSTIIKPSPKISAPSSDSSSSEEESEDEKEHAHGDSGFIISNEADQFISQRVEIFNISHTLISSQPWKGNFDLDQARQHVMRRSTGAGTIARMTISLMTDSRSRLIGVKPDAILQDPDVEVGRINKELEIMSQPFIDVMRQMVSYYPTAKFTATRMTFGEPFALVAHHRAELLKYRSTFYEKGKEGDEDDLSTSTPAFNLPNSQKCSEVAYKHIGIILDYLGFNDQPGPLQEELYRHQRDLPVCTFAMLWLLYKPGTTVYHRSEAYAEAMIVETVSGDRKIDDDETPYFLKLWQLRYDGRSVRRGNKNVIIGAFEGERPIADLKVVPAVFADKSDGGKLRAELVASGKKWYALLRGGKQQHYKGPTRQFPPQNIDTRVVVDVRSYYNTSPPPAISDYPRPMPLHPGMPPYPMPQPSRAMPGPPPPPPPPPHPGLRPNMQNSRPNESEGWVADYGEGLAICRCDKCQGARPHPPPNFPWTDYDILNPLIQESLELPSTYPDRDHRYLLCERSIWGFVLNTRTWAQLDPAYCQEPTINTAAMDSLVMPDERKRMIRAIVQKYVDPEFTPGEARDHWSADFIKNKGEGQIFLLHGGPGVGKTFAGECISENIGRPLLALTCADFGTDEVQMERNLLKWFKLAEAWGAVMLLDEADVWLERRLVSDLKRNTMVAVFLRCIEYYRGILFLTSNRVGTFDDAFISRIHVVIKYDNLGERERSKIWEQFFQKLENERKDIFVDSAAKDYVLEDSKMRTTQWNGREIRNAFQTAVSLAEYRFHHEGGKETRRKVVLDKIDFEQVCKMSVDFKSYLSSLHGDSEEDRAMRQGDRYNG